MKQLVGIAAAISALFLQAATVVPSGAVPIGPCALPHILTADPPRRQKVPVMVADTMIEDIGNVVSEEFTTPALITTPAAGRATHR